MAQKMTDDEWRAFVSHGTRTAKLSTVRADGSPHVAPVWFLLDGDEVVFNTGEDTVKGRNLVRDGRVALCVDDDRPPFDFVVLQGRARIVEDSGELRRWAARIGARYMGEERAEEFGARNGVPGELLVRVTVDKVVALKAVAD
ncbi:PPOX class F420-dependent oxidoreductase [Streptomyces sp. NPDC093586]|uniref:PPOX class F420-dependent oxidoreductase n=1 Tax=Streptomyces sp. NPDC093586 TaxID=3366042 RepID=UPI00381530FC